jgi:hypothetical protein
MEFRTEMGGHYEATRVTTRKRGQLPVRHYTLRQFEDSAIDEFGPLPTEGEGKEFMLVYDMPALGEQLYAVEYVDAGGNETRIHISSPVSWVPEEEEDLD